MVKAINGERGEEVRADVFVALSGLGVLALALLMIQLHVPSALAIGVELLVSGVCAHRWLSARRSRVLVPATV